MKTRCHKNRAVETIRSPFTSGRFVYVVKEGEEKAPPPAVPEEETIEKRKQQAREEIDAIYELPQYDTYNFRKLPEDFKDRMKKNFGEWIDANVSKYDEDKNSGINAGEYDRFKEKLNEEVQGILDRLAEIKREKKEAAEEMKETADQIKERQKRLKGVDVSRLDEANLDSADGIFTELLKYQKDFEKEARDFGESARSFSYAKEDIDTANKSHYTGATALGEYLVSLAPWAEDIPEVAVAKTSKEEAKTALETSISGMKTRQKQRQQRGEKLNGAPGKVGTKIRDEYKEKKKQAKDEKEKLVKERAANAAVLEKQKKDLLFVEQSRLKLQDYYTKIAIASSKAAQGESLMRERAADAEKAVKGLTRAADALRSRQEKPPGGGRSAGGGQAELNLEKARLGAMKTQKEISKSLLEQGIEIQGMDATAGGLQVSIIKLGQHGGILRNAIAGCETNERTMSDNAGKLDKFISDLEKEEQDRLAQVDDLDSAIATTVIEVDTSNFELIKKGEEYLAMLNSMTISGPGLLDTAGAAIKGIPGVTWAGDKLAAGWEWAKKAPVLGDTIQIIGFMGEGWVKAWDGIGGGLGWIGDQLHLQDAWDWMSNASRILENTDNVVLSWAGGLGGTVIEVFAGVTEGAKDLVKGLGMMIRNPVDLVKGLGALVNHPGMIVDALIQKDKWGGESSGKVIGRMIFDVITTLTGAGAAGTGVKTALAAIKIGEMSVGRAILLGIETFGRTFIKDIGGLVKGVVLLPKNLVKGLADLVTRIARGGKKMEPPAEAMTVAAKRAKEAKEAYDLVEAARGNPEKFKALVRKKPDIIKLHTAHSDSLAKAEKAATRRLRKKQEQDAKARKKGAETLGQETGQEAKAAAREAEVTHAEAEASAKAAKEAAVEPVKVLPELKPDFTLKKLTKERLEMLDSVKTATSKNKALRAVSQKLPGKEFTRLVRTLPDEEMRLLLNSLEGLDATMVERILKQEYKYFVENGEVVRLYVGETLGAGGFGIVSECAFVKGTGGKLDIRAVKIQRSLEPFKAEIEQIRAMLHDNKLSAEETGLTRKRINEAQAKLRTEALKPEDRIKMTREIEKLEKRLKEVTMSAETRADLGRRIAAINQHMENFNLEFIREKNGLAMAKGMPGMLQVRHMSGPGFEHMIIIDGIKALGDEPVTWQKRMTSLDIPVETTIDDLQTIVAALDNLHANGLIHGDFNGKQIFVGLSNEKRTVVLGDLALVPVDQFANGVGIRLSEPTISGRSVPVLKQLFDSTVTTTGSMSGTQGYFSYPHLRHLVEDLGDAAKEAKAAGRDATRLDIPKDVVALGDNNALGVTIQHQREFFEENRAELQAKWGMDAANFEALLGDYDQMIKRLTDPKQTIPYSEVLAQLEKAKQRIIRAKESSAEPLLAAA
jgi:hypothetical protein